MNRPFPLAVFTSAGTSTPVSTVGTDLYSTNGKSVIQCSLKGTGTGLSVVVVEGSLDGEGWVPLVTFSQTAASGNVVSEGAYIDFLWFLLRVRATQVPVGTTATVHIFREE